MNINKQKYEKSFNVNDSINRIHILMKIFEDLTIPLNRSSRHCLGLKEFKIESKIFTPNLTDLGNFLDLNRNNLLHGNEYWQSTIPLIMNLICLLLIDCFMPSDYNDNLVGYKDYLNLNIKDSSNDGSHLGHEYDELISQEIFYPPRFEF